MNRNTIRATLIAGLIAVGLAGCGATKSDAPEPTPDSVIDGTHTQVVRMPDGFRNIAVTCRGTTGIYVTSRGWTRESTGTVVSLPSSIAVLADDPACSR